MHRVVTANKSSSVISRFSCFIYIYFFCYSSRVNFSDLYYIYENVYVPYEIRVRLNSQNKQMRYSRVVRNFSLLMQNWTNFRFIINGFFSVYVYHMYIRMFFFTFMHMQLRIGENYFGNVKESLCALIEIDMKTIIILFSLNLITYYIDSIYFLYKKVYYYT